MPKYKTVKDGEQANEGYEKVLFDNGNGVDYYLDGKLHHENGPAVIFPNGKKHWYLNDKELNKDWFLKNPTKIVPMQAWELFEPEELVRLCLSTKK